MRYSGSFRWEDAYAVIEPQINAHSMHVWPFLPEFPIDVRWLEFGPKQEIRPNRHDYFELLYLYSGEVIYEVQDGRYPMRQGDLFVMSNTLLHRMGAYVRKPVRAVALYFLPDVVRAGDRTGDDVQYLMPFLVQDAGFPHVVASSTGIPAQIFDLMKRTASELPASSNRARLSVKTYLKMILVLLVNHYAHFRGSEDIAGRRERDLARLQPLFELIERNYTEAIAVEDAARAIHMSRSNFMRFFKQVTGQPFVTYLNQFRVAKAEALLARGDMSIAEVSQAVGFCDQSYFGLVFRSLMGITPREYRQRVSHPAEPVRSF